MFVFRVIGRIVLGFFAAVGILTTIIVVLNWGLFTSAVSAYDRLYLRPCYYYPDVFIDCRAGKD